MQVNVDFTNANLWKLIRKDCLCLMCTTARFSTCQISETNMLVYYPCINPYIAEKPQHKCYSQNDEFSIHRSVLPIPDWFLLFLYFLFITINIRIIVQLTPPIDESSPTSITDNYIKQFMPMMYSNNNKTHNSFN